MRLFIAFGVPEDIKAYLCSLQKLLPKEDAVMTLPKEFHQTLKFLGEVPDEKLELVKDLFSKIRFEPFEAELDKIGFFPNEKRINVVWVGIEPESTIVRLKQAVEKLFSDLFGKDDRFKPHITLCRVKAMRNKSVFLEKVKKISVEHKRFTVSSIRLIKSTLGKEGPVYETIAELT